MTIWRKRKIGLKENKTINTFARNNQLFENHALTFYHIFSYIKSFILKTFRMLLI